MDRKEAVELVNSVKYRPGYMIQAVDSAPMFGAAGSMPVNLRYITKNTRRRLSDWDSVKGEPVRGKTNAELGYPEDFHMNVTFGIPVQDKTPEEVLAYLLRSIIALEVHESREFFRVGAQDYEAPFHPHNDKGIEAWRQAAQSNTNYYKWGDQSAGVPVFTRFEHEIAPITWSSAA